MSRRPIVVGFASIVAFGFACMIAAWFVTRERPVAESPASPPEPPVAMAPRSEPALIPPPSASPAAPQAPRPVLKPVKAPESQVQVTPLFAANTRLELGRSAGLDFRARRKDAAGPAASEELSASVLKMGERAEQHLPVREVSRGVYRVEFTPRDSGQFLVAVASRGVPATTVPVLVPDASEAPEASEAGEALRDRARGMGGRGRR
jgi:hypothetical protein